MMSSQFLFLKVFIGTKLYNEKIKIKTRRKFEFTLSKKPLLLITGSLCNVGQGFLVYGLRGL